MSPAEQIIGMSGSGYVIGLGIAAYEWMAALTLLIVGKYFLPIFLRNVGAAGGSSRPDRSPEAGRVGANA